MTPMIREGTTTRKKRRGASQSALIAIYGGVCVCVCVCVCVGGGGGGGGGGYLMTSWLQDMLSCGMCFLFLCHAQAGNE